VIVPTPEHQDIMVGAPRTDLVAVIPETAEPVAFPPQRMNVADIPHGGPDFGAFLSVQPFIPLAQELQQVLVFVGQIEHEEPLLRHVEHMNPHKVVEDPPRGGVLDALAFVVWKRHPVLLERAADTVL
jgi:hypothetical protein